MWLQFLVAGFLTARVAGFGPTPLHWRGLHGRKFVLMPKASPSSATRKPYVPLQQLIVRDSTTRLSPNVIPRFASNPDKTIGLGRSGFCIEASGGKSGDAVRINHCTGQANQQWNVMPRDDGLNTWILLQDTTLCIGVARNSFNGALVQLQECEKFAQAWSSEKPFRKQNASTRVRACISLFPIVVLGALGFSVWSFRSRKESRAVVVGHNEFLLAADVGGVSLTAPLARQHPHLPPVQTSQRRVQRTVPAALPLSPTVIEEFEIDKEKKHQIVNTQVLLGPSLRHPSLDDQDCLLSTSFVDRGRRIGEDPTMKMGSRGRRTGKGNSGKGFVPRSGAIKKKKKSSAILPAGTLVKHGTTSDVLPQILSQGLRPSGTVSAGIVRDVFEERPTSQGVYIAKSYAAYATAFVAFSSKMQHPLANRFGDTAATVPLPVVLNIRLQEDCMLGPDEDYLKVDKELNRQFKKALGRDDAIEQLWQRYGSGAILREDGLPAQWIESVECPHVPSAGCLERAFYHLGEVGEWNKMPRFYASLAKDLAQSLPSLASAFESDSRSLQLLFDDVFKLVYGQDLCPEDPGFALSAFESMEKWEEGDRLMYVTPSFQLGLYGVSQTFAETWDPAPEQRKKMGIRLSGTCSDWARLDPNEPGLMWWDSAEHQVTETMKSRDLRAGYARMLIDIAMFFCISCKQPMAEPLDFLK